MAAAIAKMMNGSTLRCSLVSIQSSGLNLPSASGPQRDAVRDLAGDIVDLEIVDALGAALAGEDVGPGGLDAAAEGADRPHPGDDDAAQFHRWCRSGRGCAA